MTAGITTRVRRPHAQSRSVTSRPSAVDIAYQSALATFPLTEDVDPPGVVAFVQSKRVDLTRVAYFLSGAAQFNRWANRGPAWHALSAAYESYFANVHGLRVAPVANGGIALEALANLHSVRAGRPLRWCVSAFSFMNAGRGIFADAIKLDCDARGVLSLDAVRAQDPADFDGIVVTNPFGLLQDFSAFAEWQRETGKALLIDNAAGVGPGVPDLPYQAFSLHHTKPFGVGEGGLALVPEDEFEQFLGLVEYKPLPEAALAYWVNNGKVSELACASHLVRLEDAATWVPQYHEQAARVSELAARAGLRPLLPEYLPAGDAAPAMSLPFVAPHPIAVEALPNEHVRLAKYYKPLAPAEQAATLFEHLINVPTHPDMWSLTDTQIRNVLERVLEPGR